MPADSEQDIIVQSDEEYQQIPNRWDHLCKILERESPFDTSGYEPSDEALKFVNNDCRVLVVGAGGLGCELLKDLCLMGFRHIDVIDMDTIELSNLNRQFLFRPKDIGRPKATVAAEFVNARVPGAKICGHYAKIQDFSGEFYRQFNVVVCGLDSIMARRWINAMLVSLLDYEQDNGNLIESSVIPLVDGGTEGFKGNARVILPGMSACLECQLDLYPPPVNYPLCTVAQTPRLPEHCVEWVKVLVWPKEWPFGARVAIDGDDHAHIQWIYERALERCKQYGIGPLTYRLTQGVVKRIIPAVASTNACIAAACANEVFKLATSCACPMNNYMVLNLSSSIYTYTFEAERKVNCLVCTREQRMLSMSKESTLRDVVDLFMSEEGEYQMKAPAITTHDAKTGKHRTLYMKSVASLEEATRANLDKTLAVELSLLDGQQLQVVDVTHPTSLLFTLRYLDTASA